MPTDLTERFADALQAARELYPNGDDDRAPPREAHRLQVAGLVLEAGGDEDEAIAAVFHDAVQASTTAEETEARTARIRESFGDRPADIVMASTDRSADDSDEDSWKARKEQYIHHLWTEADDAAVRVSAADKLATARKILRDYREHGESAWSRYEGGRSGTLWYYRSLVGAYRYRGIDGHVDELDRLVSTLEEETNLS